MIMNNFFILILILSIYSSLAESFQSSRPRWRQRSALEKLQQNQCSYGGGTINNSTVIELGNCFNYFYFIGLNIGTQGQYFNFLFDTGSPTLWIPLGTNPSGFNQTASSTYSITTIPGQITYGGGSKVSGNMGHDILQIKQTPITTNYPILFATSSTASFDDTDVYGLVGMDYKSYPNFLDLAYQKGQISTPVFSLQLRNSNETSILYYNDGLPQSVKQNIVWVSMPDTSQFWQLDLISFTIGGVNMSNLAANILVVDSGTSFLAFNQLLYNKIIQNYFSGPDCQQDSGNTYCLCNITWPNLTFMVKGIQIYIPGQVIKSDIGNGICQLSMQSTSINQIILGDVFFRQYIVTFDRPNLRIGLSKQVAFEQTYDPHYFIIIQYFMCGAQILLGFVGISYLGWIYVISGLNKKFQSTLGTELTKY